MNSILRKIVAAGWRRRYLMFVPFLALSLAGFAAALLLPRTYVSSALLLLQEEGRVDPLRARDSRTLFELNTRVGAISALATSQSVLSRTVAQIAPDAEEAQAAFMVEDLRRRVSINSVGTQFIEIHLSGSDRFALKPHLDALISNLLEALLVPQQETRAAPDYLIQVRRRQIEFLDVELATLRASVGDFTEETMARKLKTRIDALQDVETARQRLEAEEAKAEAADAERMRLEQAEASPEDAAQTSEDAQAAVDLQASAAAAEEAADDALAALRADLDAAMERLTAAEAVLETHLLAEKEKDSIEARIAASQEELARLETRFRASQDQPIVILGSPEHIKLIDEPSVPDRPAKSALLILLAGIAAGGALGGGLAVAAEQFDQSVRTPEDLAHVVGAPLVARLPKLTDSALNAAVRQRIRLRIPPPIEDASKSSGADADQHAAEGRA